MSVNSFWLIILRLTGILLFFSGLDVMFSYFNTAFFLFEADDLIFIILFLLSVTFYGFILYAFTLNPMVMVRLLKLYRHTEGEELKIDKSFDFMLRLALIIVGVFLIVDNLPEVIKGLFSFFQTDAELAFSPYTPDIIYFVIKLTIGYVFLTYSHVLAKFLKKRLDENPDVLDEAKVEADL